MYNLNTILHLKSQCPYMKSQSPVFKYEKPIHVTYWIYYPKCILIFHQNFFNSQLHFFLLQFTTTSSFFSVTLITLYCNHFCLSPLLKHNFLEVRTKLKWMSSLHLKTEEGLHIHGHCKHRWKLGVTWVEKQCPDWRLGPNQSRPKKGNTWATT